MPYINCAPPLRPTDQPRRRFRTCPYPQPRPPTAPPHQWQREPRKPDLASHADQRLRAAVTRMISLIIPEITETPLWWWCPSFSLRLFRPPLRFLLLLFTLHSTEGLLPAGSSPGPYPNPNPTDLVGDGRARASRRRRRGEAPDPGGGEEAGARAALLFRKSALLNLGSFLRG
jgi:hypothetical protein